MTGLKVSNGPSGNQRDSDKARQLYTMVSVPGFTYGAEVWYTPTFKLAGAGKMKGSVAITNKLRSTQRGPHIPFSVRLMNMWTMHILNS